MRPATKSTITTRNLEKPDPTSAENDAMMMGFEFIDEKGKLNPRKIFFTKEKCPNETQRVLSNLFGKIMQWSACRWAENLLKNILIDETTANEKIKAQLDNLLQDIRQDGLVSMTKLFSVVASASQEAQQPDKKTTNLTASKKPRPLHFFQNPF